MIEIVAVTVAVNYSDILKHVLSQNCTFFKTWIIVTSSADKKTIQLIKRSGKKNIKTLIYNDFYIDDCKFNKGGALKFAQEYVCNNFNNTNILILDADIWLPDDFMEKLPDTLEDDSLYGASERLDYWSIEDFTNNTNPHRHPYSRKFIGFFQLYKQSPDYKYQQSINCGDCDLMFKELFSKKVLLKLSVKHLGQKNINWDGTVSKIE